MHRLVSRLVLEEQLHAAKIELDAIELSAREPDELPAILVLPEVGERHRSPDNDDLRNARAACSRGPLG
jgi:hypothetical protein